MRIHSPHAYPLLSTYVHIQYQVYPYAYPLPTCLSTTQFPHAYPLPSIPICVSTHHVLIHYSVPTCISTTQYTHMRIHFTRAYPLLSTYVHIHYPVCQYAYPLPTCLSVTQYLLRAYPLDHYIHSTHMRINYPSAYPLNSTSVLIHYLVLMCLSITE